MKYIPFYADAQRPPNKRRKRKGSNSGSGANSAPPVPNKKRSPGPNFSLASQVVVSFYKINDYLFSHLMKQNSLKLVGVYRSRPQKGIYLLTPPRIA